MNAIDNYMHQFDNECAIIEQLLVNISGFELQSRFYNENTHTIRMYAIDSSDTYVDIGVDINIDTNTIKISINNSYDTQWFKTFNIDDTVLVNLVNILQYVSQYDVYSQYEITDDMVKRVSN